MARRPAVIESDPGTRPEAVAEDGVDVYAWAHNETSTAVMAPVVRPAGADEAWSSSTPPPAPAACRSTSTEVDAYYFAPQKCFASDGGLWIALMSPAALERAARSARPTGTSRRSSTSPTAIDNSGQEPDLQHPVGRHAVPDGRAARLDEQPGRPQPGMVERTTDSSDALYGWAERRRTPRRTSPTRRTARWSSAPSTSTTRSTPPPIAETLRANGIVDTEPYRKLGRNQLRIAMYPAVDPADVEALTKCIDWVVDHLWRC